MGFGLPVRGFGLVVITKPHNRLNLGTDPPPLGGKSPDWSRQRLCNGLRRIAFFSTTDD